MASPADDWNRSNIDTAVHQRVLSQFRGEWVNHLKVEQLFMLIDGVLPFEACLYYQVLPLFMEGNRLHLGMVSPDDTAASEYVRRIISYLNYSLLTHSISSEALRVVLTAYLSYMGNQQPGLRPNALSYGHHRHTTRAQIDRRVGPSDRQTLVVDSPDDLYTASGSPSEVVISPLTPPPAADLAPELIEPKEPVPLSPIQRDLEPAVTLIVDDPPVDDWTVDDRTVDNQTVDDRMIDGLPDLTKALPEGSTDDGTGAVPESGDSVPSPVNSLDTGNPFEHADRKAEIQAAPEPTIVRPEVPPVRLPRSLGLVQNGSAAVATVGSVPERNLVILNLTANYISSPVEVLAELPPQELLQELLARVLFGGIGRLFFERHPQHGRIVWSQNGILQSVMDHLPVSTFEGIIQALKTMACTSVLPVEQPHQTEMEYLYDRSRVLLRFRFMPSAHGEEATIQVLRGAAMKFYQQQQISKLEKDAVTIAQQLQHKLNEIRARAYSDPALLESRSKILPRLSELLQHMERELDELGVHPVE
jgi:Type II secretion system (T2SS), protein E, N-terminal domain